MFPRGRPDVRALRRTVREVLGRVDARSADRALVTLGTLRLQMLERFIPPPTRRLVLYPKPINVRWGPDRLRVACERELGLTLDRATAVIFHNRKQDTLVLYTLDRDGDRCITKKLERGRFLLPVPAAGEKYAVLEASKVASLFRT